tara:strand:- start:30 stop:746 length:717 start_codon:yes stop_codon:yes gene_type:complete
MSTLNRQDLEKVLETPILDFDLYVRACTHKSSTKSSNERSYERLEFLGDSVLNFIVTRMIFDRYPNSNEGFMTRIRTKLVSGDNLSRISRDMGLSNFVIMNNRAYTQNWNSNKRILEDVFESLVGAMYMDRGMPHCRRFLERVLSKYISWEDIIQDTNHKDQLMRVCQRNGWKMPVYEINNVNGPDHRKCYHIDVHVNDYFAVGQGVHANKRKAEQLAAKSAIELLNLSVPKSAATSI